jgi:site-specific DNA recombinase
MSARRRLSAVPDQPRLAVLYVRVSALMGRGGEDFHSPDLQLDAMRRLAQRRDLREVEVVQDIDRSGRDFTREGVQRVMELARAKAIDVVAVYDLSRFGRNTGESLRHIAELRDLGVSVVSTVEQIDDTPEGQFMLGQFLGMAQLYSDQIGRRWSQVITRRAEQGRWHGSNPPYGYRLAAGRLEPDPAAAALMTDAFKRYAAGHLVSHIARDITATRGRLLAVSTLKRSLGNPVYVGRVALNGIERPGVHESIVDDVTWQKVQRRLARDRRTPSRHLATSHSLVGLVVCDHCGRKLQLHVDPPRAGRKEDVPRLQCRRRLHGGADVCPGPGTPAVADVERAVLEQIPALVARLKSDAGERQAKQARRVRAGVDVDRLRRELTKTETAIGRLTVDRARREISEQAYQLAAAELEQAAAALREQIDETEAVAAAPTARATVKAAEGLLALWDGMRIDLQNRALREIVREVRIRRAVSYREPVSAEPGGRVAIEWL